MNSAGGEPVFLTLRFVAVSTRKQAQAFGVSGPEVTLVVATVLWVDLLRMFRRVPTATNLKNLQLRNSHKSIENVCWLVSDVCRVLTATNPSEKVKRGF